ncbi:CsbD family protein [Amycolatopsis mongoliensis]|uniref:CsbD family protein n=1 Tax=Amycolatopsis mongoliensis TaxID=715475 RepID=A0A9Y2NFY9_9PSEU|nr:CsbD family protein [Amycolatopsis sp. 4-36]WIX98127.1 CsbD family protein [Amycolatopsis sp. 4-36]
MNAKIQQWKARIKQAAGTLTGNKKLEREGRADRATGEVKQRLTQAKRKIDEVIDKGADAVKGTMGSGKDSTPPK